MGRNLSLGLLTFLLGMASAMAQTSGRDIAVFVVNLAGVEFVDEAAYLENELKIDLTLQGFSVIPRAKVAAADGTTDTEVDDFGRKLTSDVSLLEVADELEADFVLVASIVSYGPATVRYYALDRDLPSLKHVMRVSTALLAPLAQPPLVNEDYEFSGSLETEAGTTNSSHDLPRSLVRMASPMIAQNTRITLGIAEPTPEELEQLAATQLAPAPPVMLDAEGVEQSPRESATSAASVSQPPAESGPVSFSITPRLEDVFLPNLQLDESNVVSISHDQYPVLLHGIAVEFHGLLRGHAPGDFTTQAGLQTVRLSGFGLLDWVEAVDVMSGSNLSPTMSLSSVGMEEWERLSAFVSEFQDGDILDEEQAERLRQDAAALRAFGFQVDVSDVPGVGDGITLWLVE
ncbi:MAG: hypothetical protein AAFX93_15915 [Verrucomicrobiota bacterium]